MPLLNFKKQFANAVESGIKRQTIRTPRKHEIKTGDTLYLYTGLRTSSTRKLRTAKCSSVQIIRIAPDGISFSGDEICELSKMDKFAQADGFNNYSEMLAWFEEQHGLPFVGILIKWEAEV